MNTALFSLCCCSYKHQEVTLPSRKWKNYFERLSVALRVIINAHAVWQ